MSFMFDHSVNKI